MKSKILVFVMVLGLSVVSVVVSYNYLFITRVEADCGCGGQSSCPTGCYLTRFEALSQKKKIFSTKELEARRQAVQASLPQRKGHLLSEMESSESIVTFDELWIRREELVDTVVKVSGQITTSGGFCTEIACSKDDPYCNTCTYYYALTSGSQPGNKLEIESKLYEFIGCYGGNPNKPLDCQPLEVGRTYLIKGWLKQGSSLSNSRYHLEYLGHFPE